MDAEPLASRCCDWVTKSNNRESNSSSEIDLGVTQELFHISKPGIMIEV